MSKILISILNYNGTTETKKCIDSLNKIHISENKVKLFLIDNASKKPITNKEFSTDLDYELIQSKINLGFSGGHNLAFKYAIENNFDYVLILNNDTIVSNDFLINLLDSFKQGKIGAVGPKVYFTKGSEFHKDRYSRDELGRVTWFAGGEIDWSTMIASHKGVDQVDVGQFNSIEETEFVTGCCMMMPVDILKIVGIFDDKYFLYLEDLDLNMRIEKAGFKLIFNPHSIIWHTNAASSGGSGSKLQDYYITRNRLLFGLKYAPFRTKINLLRESVRLLKNGREWQKKAIKDFYRHNLGKGSYG